MFRSRTCNNEDELSLPTPTTSAQIVDLIKSLDKKKIITQKRKAAEDFVYESWSRTEQCKVRGLHFWTIDDFLHRASIMKEGESLLSSFFIVPVDLSFQLKVFPKGEDGEGNTDYLSVYLFGVNRKELEVNYVFSIDFSVQKADGTPFGTKNIRKSSRDCNKWGFKQAFSRVLLSEKQDELLPYGKLTIICNLEIYYVNYSCYTKGQRQRPSINFKTEETPISGDSMVEYFGNEELSDVIINCGEKSFPCHKVILAARSDVFAAMFKHKNMAENMGNKVEITDVDPEALEQLLLFIYADKTSPGDMDVKTASSLLTAADKYNIQPLKKICEQTICENIQVANAAEALMLAYLHEAKNLKTVVIDFVMSNMEEVMETTGWKVINESNPKILNEIFKAIKAKI